MAEEEDEETEWGSIDVEYSPNNEFHIHVDIPKMPEGVSNLFDQIGGWLAEKIENIRENEFEGEIGEIDSLQTDKQKQWKLGASANEETDGEGL